MFEDEEDYEERNFKNLPIFQKGQEIMDVVRQIAELIPDDNEHLEYVK